MIKILMLSLICLISVMLLLQLIYILTDHPKFIFHDLFGQHRPDNKREQRGINTCSKCRLCGKDIMQDSQGNWF